MHLLNRPQSFKRIKFHMSKNYFCNEMDNSHVGNHNKNPFICKELIHQKFPVGRNFCWLLGFAISPSHNSASSYFVEPPHNDRRVSRLMHDVSLDFERLPSSRARLNRVEGNSHKMHPPSDASIRNSSAHIDTYIRTVICT